MFRPRADYILVKELPRDDSKVIAIVSNKKTYRAEVVETGPGRYVNRERDSAFIPMTVKKGDIVNYGETPVQFPEYTENGYRYRLIQEADVAFIEE